MTGAFKKPSTFTKIEFWAITAIFAFAIFFFIANGLSVDDNSALQDTRYKPYFEAAKVPFDFYKNYFIPQFINHIIRFSFVLYMNFVLIPKLFKKQSLVRDIFFIIMLIAFAGALFGITNTYLMGYQYKGSQERYTINQGMFLDGYKNAFIIIWFLAIYTAIKYAGIYLLAISGRIEAQYRFIRKEAIVATAVWMAGLLFLRFARAEEHFILVWLIVIPSAIALYLFSFYRLIPRSLARNNYQFFFYILNCTIILFVAFLTLYLVSIFIIYKDDAGVWYSAFNSFFQLFITVPVTWLVYKKHLTGNEEINVLQKELKQSTASIDFLRSQINPHFLFNALNTLYGTAIQENADRTSEGIQKLGDMMRFMLQENMQDKISLVREVEYLNNYISLQKLRTAANPDIKIETDITEQVHTIQIAPMLLIPFVENAFKHGISFREPSHIKVTLQVKDNTLYFEVSNSKHDRQDSDPEKDKSGIGLENVQQRLRLLYPNRHELIIRDTAKEFFVHLIIQLSKPV